MAYAEKVNQKYRGIYRDAFGRKRTAGWSTSKREARALAQAEELKVRRGAWRDPDAGRMLFSEYFEQHWLPNRLREANTVATYRAHFNSALKDTFGEMEERKISPAIVQLWVAARVALRVEPSTIKTHFRTLGSAALNVRP